MYLPRKIVCFTVEKNAIVISPSGSALPTAFTDTSVIYAKLPKVVEDGHCLFSFKFGSVYTRTHYTLNSNAQHKGSKPKTTNTSGYHNHKNNWKTNTNSPISPTNLF